MIHLGTHVKYERIEVIVRSFGYSTSSIINIAMVLKKYQSIICVISINY